MNDPFLVEVTYYRSLGYIIFLVVLAFVFSFGKLVRLVAYVMDLWEERQARRKGKA